MENLLYPVNLNSKEGIFKWRLAKEYLKASSKLYIVYKTPSFQIFQSKRKFTIRTSLQRISFQTHKRVDDDKVQVVEELCIHKNMVRYIEFIHNQERIFKIIFYCTNNSSFEIKRI